MTARHAGITKTLQLITPYYWWPNLKTFITEYVKGCATCQMTKVNTHPTHPPMFPITPADNAQPFETIAMDFITKLLQSGGFDTILTITDTNCSKASIFIPCHETIDSEGVALLYLNHVIPHYGIPCKIISDHDVCFVLKFSTELCRILNIHQNISTAYHPQTDGASERTNQTLEQYLQVFCGTQQDNWHAWLPLAQYTKNSWPSTTTKKTPYDLLIGYTPQVHQPTRKTTIPSLEQRLSSIKEARKATQEAQRKAQESWIKEKPQYIPFAAGSRVWLEGTNLQLPSNTTPKLSPRRYRPFKVVSQISKVAYKLKLPSTWKIHDVFHTSLLTPYKETDQHSPNFIKPPPDILEGKPKWEVKKILKERSFGHWKKKQYLMCWKGYSPAHDSWTNSKDLHALELLADFQNQSRSIRTLHFDNSPPSPSCPVTSPSLTIKAMSTSKNSAPSTPVNVLTGMVTYPFSQQSSPQDMPPVIVGPLDNNMVMDTSSPVRTPWIITLGELPAPPVTSPNPTSQSSTPPLPVPPPTFLAPPHATELSTSPSQRLLALADATVNATTSPLPFDDRSPNPPLSSIPATPNPSPSHPLTPVDLHHT